MYVAKTVGGYRAGDGDLGLCSHICKTFDFTYAKRRFSDDAAHIIRLVHYYQNFRLFYCM